MTTTKQKIKQAAAQRRRSSFRDEFYKDARKPVVRKTVRNTAKIRGGQSRFPLWFTAGGLGLLFCIIAVGGSSAIIWLRKLGAIFGVHWAGD